MTVSINFYVCYDPNGYGTGFRSIHHYSSSQSGSYINLVGFTDMSITGTDGSLVSAHDVQVLTKIMTGIQLNCHLAYNYGNDTRYDLDWISDLNPDNFPFMG